MSTATFTLVHVILSLVGIAAGMVVLFGMLASKRLEGWTALFLSTTVLTSVTGFFFPFERFLPSHAFGIISLLVLPVTLVARYRRHLAGRWRSTYVVTAVILLYLNAFVLVAQAFAKILALHELAPTQSEPPFAVSQAFVLVLFAVATVLAVSRFRQEPAGNVRRGESVRTVVPATALTVSND